MQSATRSLLRYPGSKARLARFIAKSILLNDLKRPIFVEPFCGGSSVSIALLDFDIVDEVVINDIDPLVASLWKCVFSKKNSQWLAEAVLSVPLTLEFWEYQKNIKPDNVREMALKCLYLNRTSFSGVLNKSAGPIGGRSQSKWTVGCRFNREKIATRITELAKLSCRVKSINNLPWQMVCKKWAKNNNTLIYLDPPFYNKANRLYRYYFDKNDHQQLHQYLMTLQSPWMLSYDNTSEILELYNHKGLNSRIIDNTYSAHPIGGNSFIGRELLYSNLCELPLPENKKNKCTGLSIKDVDMFSYKIHIDKVPLYANNNNNLMIAEFDRSPYAYL